MSNLDDWQEWAVVQLQECFMNGLSPGETAALIGKSEQEVRAKARSLGLLLPSLMESPPTAPEFTASVLHRSKAN
jgi:uncharacterized protein YoaH (UPF0181 family)